MKLAFEVNEQGGLVDGYWLLRYQAEIIKSHRDPARLGSWHVLSLAV